MSCSKCGSVNTSCGCKDTAYTTPKVYTCPPDTSCPQPVRCSEFMDAACIFLNDGIADAGIQPGSSLESIVQQLILLVTNPGCVDAPGGVPGGGTVNFVDAVWPGNAIIIAGGPIQNSGTFIFNGQGTSLQYIDGQGNLQDFPQIPQAIEFQTNGTPNSVQDLLNLVAGVGITLTESNGSVTIDVDAVDYSVQNGLSEQPVDSGVFELGAPTSPGAPLLHDTYIAGSQYAFEINNTASMYLQGNRVDIEGADPGVKVLSTGGASDNSLEVTGTQVAIESVGSGSTRIFLDPAKIRIQTPLFNIKQNNDVLTLIDKTTGEVEFKTVAGALFQTDGNDNADQTLLNLVPGNGITLTNVGGDVTIDGPLFQTNTQDNSIQTLLNLVQGTGITLTESGGTVTIDADAPAINLTTNDIGGPSTYDPGTGDLNIPVYQTQLDIVDEVTSKVINPTMLKFVGAGVTVTNSGLEAIITIPGGGGPGNVDANNGLILNTTDYPEATVQLGGPDTAPAPLVRNTYILTSTTATEFDFDISGSRVTKPIINVSNTGQGTAVKGISAGGYAIYGTTASGFSGYFEADNSLIGLYSVSKTGNLSAEFESVSSVNNTVIPVVRVMRTVNISSPGVNGADGIGASVDFFLEDDNNVAAQAGAISYEFTDATSGATVSQFAVTTADAGSLSRKLEITGAGQLILNNYTTATSFDPESGPSVGVLNVDNAGNVFVAGGAGFEAQVNTNFVSSTVLNLLDSADITVQDLGGGDVSFVLANPSQTYTVNNGLSSQTTPSVDPNNFQLGGPLTAPAPLLHDSYIQGGDKSLTITGDSVGNDYIFGITSTSGLAPTGSGSQKGLFVELSGANTNATANSYAGYFVNNHTGTIAFNRAVGGETSGSASIAGAFTSTGGTGVDARASGGGNAIIATVTSGSGNGIFVSSQDGEAIYAKSVGNLALVTNTAIPAFLNSVFPQVRHDRQVSPGTIPGNGIGLSEEFYIATSSSPYQSYLSNQIISKWADATSTSRTSEFSIAGVNNAVTQTQFTIIGTGTSGPGGAWTLLAGQIKFDRYAAGAIYKSANDLSANSGFNLGIDANGNIWATDFSTSTGPVTGVSSISIGILSNGANATINNPSGPSATIDIAGQNAYTQIQADSGTAQNATVYNEAFKITGAQGITTSIASPSSLDTVTINGPAKYYTVQTQTSAGAQVGLYTPAAWNSQLKIKAGNGISITDGGAGLDTIIIASSGGGPTGGTVTNVSGTDANGFTFNISNPTTTPNITLGTNLTGILVGDGTGMTAIAPPTGSGVLTYNSTTNTYSYTTVPTVNDGQLLLASNTAGLTNTGVAINYTTTGAPPVSTGPFSANKATNSSLQLSIGPAITGLVGIMTGVLPSNPATSPGAQEVLPRYITKLAQDTYILRTPVTTFSTGTTGLNITNAVSTAVSTPLNGQVVLGGVLNVANGGTGTSTAPTAGQILIGNSSGGYSAATITGSGGTTVTAGDGTINISSSLGNVLAKNGTYVNADGSVRLGSGAQTTDPPALNSPSPLIEYTIVRLSSWLFRLADGTDGVVDELGFDVNDANTVKRGYLGTPTKGFWFSANTATAAAPTSAFQGFVYGGQTSNAFPTNMSGFLFTPTGAATFPATFSGVAVDTPNARIVTGYLGTNVYDIISRTGNTITQYGQWGGTAAGNIANFLMYQANATSKLISIGDVSLVGNSTRFQVDDSASRFNFNKGLLYASGYGAATPVGLDAGSISRNFVLGTASNGKIYEIPGISIGSIIVGANNYTPTTLATGAAANALTVVGAGTVGVALSGSTLTITGNAAAFPYWSTINLTTVPGSTGVVTGDANVTPGTNGANTLNLQAGNNITFTASEAGDRIQISATAPAVNSWGTITLTASGGTVSGGPIAPDAVLDPLTIYAGAGISLTGSASGALTDSLQITNTGVLSLAVGTTDAFSITSASGAYTVNIPYRWRTIAASNTGSVIGSGISLMTPTVAADILTFNGGPGVTLTTDPSTRTLTISSSALSANAWYNIAAVNSAPAGTALGPLIPDATQDTLTFAGGTGISVTLSDIAGALDRVVITNTGVTSITTGTNSGVSVSTSGGVTTISGTYNSNNGVWEESNTIFQLGAPLNSQNLIPFTQDRYIYGNNTNTGSTGYKLDISTPIGAGRGVLELTSTNVGRALRAVNTEGTAPEGAIYALAGMDASPDSAPTGTIYSESTAKGHAIVGVSNAVDNQAISAIFGKGRQGVKGYTVVAGGTGVYGEADVSINGIGINGVAKGEFSATGGGANLTYAGYFSIKPDNFSQGVEILRLDRSTTNLTGLLSGSFGGTIGYYLTDSSSANIRAGQVGYTWGKTQTGDSRFKVTVRKTSTPSASETVRLELRETGQLFLNRYNGLDRVYPAADAPANRDKGPFVPESGSSDSPTGANYAANVYDYLVPGSKVTATATDEEGRLDTLRNTQGKYTPAITASSGGAPFTGSSPSIRAAYFTRLNNIVQGTIRIQFSAIQVISTGGSFDIVLPVFADANFGTADDLLGTAVSKLNVSGQVTANGRFDNISVNAVVATTNKLRFSFTVPVAQSSGITNEFTIQFMYTLY